MVICFKVDYGMQVLICTYIYADKLTVPIMDKMCISESQTVD